MREFIYTIKFNSLDTWLIMALILTIVAIFLIPTNLILSAIFIVLLAYFAWQRPLIGLMTAALLYPFSQAYFYFGAEINIPYADLIILFVLLIWIIKVIRDSIVGGKIVLTKKSLGNLLPLILLLFSGLLSISNIWNEQIIDGIYYLIRFVVFTYLAYFWLTQELITKAKYFWLISYVLYALGIFLSIMGMVALLWPELDRSFPMATPLAWFGLFPFGASHNLLAESLVSIIPISWLIAYKYKNEHFSKWLFLGVVVMIGVCLLTFSRTGWLVLLLELFILFYFYAQDIIKYLAKKLWWIGIIGLFAILIYLGTWAQTEFVTSSNQARIAMIEKSLDMFYEHPILGNGIGTWQNVVSYDRHYTYQFGNPPEQHGVIWKLLAEQGLIGVAAWLLIMGYFIKKAINNFIKFTNDNPWRWGALVALVIIIGQFVFQLFDTGYYSPKMWLPLGLAFALINISAKYIDLNKKQ